MHRYSFPCWRWTVPEAISAQLDSFYARVSSKARSGIPEGVISRRFP